MKKIEFLFLLFLLSARVLAQTCDGRGQKPSTAFPVCGTSVFKQTTVPLCSGRKLPSPRCRSTGQIADVNPFWYKFTCFESGTLGFTITPANLSDDYDWELYDVTGRNPDDIYTDGSLVVSSNWSGEEGKTGAGASGKSLFVCAGLGQDLYSSMATLQKGHNYLLLISHFTQTQSGYDLAFGGGTAVITDPLTPHLSRAEAVCSGDVIRLKLNKRMKCSSVAANGSDFLISVPGLTIRSSTAIDCSSGFDTDSIEIKLDRPLPAGTYQLIAKRGSDDNTLLDYCDRAILENEVISFTVFPNLPTPMDSLVPVRCAPQTFKLVFRKPISCSSIAANGSDFKIVGSYPVSVSRAEGICNASGYTREIWVTVSKALQQKGNFTLVLQQGSDGNTLIDECAKETPAGAALPFVVKDTVDAHFTYTLRYGCAEDTVDYFHDGKNEVSSWQWNMDNNRTSALQSPQARYAIFNQKQVTLVVSNGFCSDTLKQVVNLDNFLKADFNSEADNCPLEPVQFTSTAVGKLSRYAWNFGDGTKATEPSPKHVYQQPGRETSFPVSFTVTDSLGCQQSVTKAIKIYSSCVLFVPNAFTPNNDGINDFFRVLNAVKADKFELKIFNRWGQLLYQTNDWKKGWDGRYRGAPQSAGAYVWFLHYIDKQTGKR